MFIVLEIVRFSVFVKDGMCIYLMFLDVVEIILVVLLEMMVMIFLVIFYVCVSFLSDLVMILVEGFFLKMIVFKISDFSF